ncbi:uncharacterized protein LOC129313862 [Prosopis cineraria]|uniref:uncharacterized protein LOC129313862 n=1 Tax=Prosopis cineraria TaxID=364024 RepID=UPI00240FE3E2|nr:uncharacterized protein LOC129313862 [Prosopis cineraria]
MSRFLRRAIPFRRHIIKAISPSKFQPQLCLQSQWFPVRYANSNASNESSFMVSYLIDTCGFSPKEAEAASKRLSFETREKPDLVIKFLKSQGFSQPLILGLIRKAPWFLRSDPEKTFLPRIEFFKSRALEHSSGILLRSRTSTAPKIEIFREAGVPESNIIKYLQFYSRSFTFSSPARIKKIVEEVKELGFDPLKLQFLMAVHVCLSLKKSTLAKKANALKKWGFSDHDILAAFRKFPCCLTLSEDKIDATLEFLIHKLGCDPSVISSTYPFVLGYSLKKRLVPRGAVLQVLLSKGLVKRKTLLSTMLYTENDFLRRLVLCHGQEANALLELYRAKLDQAK